MSRKSWHTSNGVFQIKGIGKFTFKFFEYSNSHEFLAEPGIVRHEKDEMKPMFDLILGIKTMHELGIILDCKNKMITIDEITLPMRIIKSLTNKCKAKRALAAHSLLSQELKSTKRKCHVTKSAHSF